MSMPDGTNPSALERNLVERVCVGDIIARSAGLYPTRTAIVDGDRRIDYANLDRKINQLGHALLALGLQQQDVVAVMARNCAELLLTYFACARAGLICAPVNLGLRADEIAWCLRDAKATVLVIDSGLSDLAQAVLAEDLPALQHRFWMGGGRRDDDFDTLVARGSPQALEVQVQDRDVVQLLYTSGTTANPKGVLTSHLAVTMAGLANAIAFQCRPDSVVLVALPLFHCAMLNSVVMPFLVVGATVVLTKGFEPVEAAHLIDIHQVNFILLLPMMYGLWLNDPAYCKRTFPSVKRAHYAMAPMSDERLKAIHALFPNADVVLGSGQTEFTPATCMQRPEHQWSKAASWGTATVMTQVAIMDDDGHLLPRGATGEIVYRGPQVMQGYLNLPEETRKSFRHGWFHSGDVAHIDEDGAIWFKDRYKDVIKTGGENVASIEVERCLLSHPDVAEAAVVGVPHDRWGETITGVVVRRAGSSVDEATLLAYCRERLSGFKIPKVIVFVQEFPRTGTGKLQKNLVRTQLKDLFKS